MTKQSGSFHTKHGGLFLTRQGEAWRFHVIRSKVVPSYEARWFLPTKHGGLSMAFPVEHRGRSSFELRENCQEVNHVIASISKNLLAL